MDLPEDVKKSIGSNEPEKISIIVLYKNYRGESAERRIIPLSIFYGSTEYHKEDQWLLNVWDLDKKARRTYALRGIEKWIKK